MFNKNLADKIDAFIKDKFDVIYEFKFDGLVFLRGGTIRSLIMGIPVKDLDFVILTQGKCQIIDFIRKFKLKYHKNAGGGYKIIYNNFKIDISSYTDLLDTARYDIDYIFYDIERHFFISCGGFRAIERRTITEVNSQMVALKKNILRLKKIIKFVKYVSCNDDKVKVKQNNGLFRFKLYKKEFKNSLNKVFNNSFRKCFRFLDGYKKEFNIIFLFKVLLTVISICVPILLGLLYEEIMIENYKNIVLVALLIIVLKIFTIVVSKKQRKNKYVLRRGISYNICRSVSECILNCELDKVDDDNGFINKLKYDPDSVPNYFEDIGDMGISLSGSFIMLFVIFCLDYRIGILFLISILIVELIKRYNVKNIRRKRGFFKKHINDMFNCLGTFGDMFYFKNDSLMSDEQLIVSGNSKIVKIIHNILFVIVFIITLLMVVKGKLEISSFIILFLYGIVLYSVHDKIDRLFYSFFFLSRSCYRLFNLIEGPLYVREAFGDKYSSKCFGKIEFNNVMFRYNHRENCILSDCSFCVKPNEILAIVGSSGSGKTTMLNLIARLYNVSDGEILIDGVNIDEYSEEFIRDNVSIISQSPYLFDMSIKENLRLVKENITDKEIDDICKLVCLDKFINTLPYGYDTTIGKDGIELSGIQKQKLGIARALINNIKIILLDNVASDSEGDAMEMKKIIKNISRKCSVLVVTGDESVLKICSKILILVDGRVISSGTHKELIKDCEIYSNLYKTR